MLDVLAAIPDAAVLPGDAQQSSAAFAADVGLWLCAGWSDDAVSGILFQLGHKRRRLGIRGKDRQGAAGRIS